MQEQGAARDRKGWLSTVSQGGLLGQMRREDAELAFAFDKGREVAELTWTGESLFAALRRPYARVVIEEAPGGGASITCSLCRSTHELCPHAGAVLLRWLTLRRQIFAKGPGTVWREGALQPFFTPAPAELQEIDLTHLSNPDELAAALRFQLSLQHQGPVPVRLGGDRIEIHVTLLSGIRRVVVLAGTALPQLFLDRSLRLLLALEGELGGVSLSRNSLPPVLRASIPADGSVLLEPGYRQPDGTLIPLEKVQRGPSGPWTLADGELYLLPSPPPRLLPYFLRGRTALSDSAALRYLSHDHFLLHGDPRYEPTGELAGAPRLVQPSLASVEVLEESDDSVLVKPSFVVGSSTLRWSDVRKLIRVGFGRRAGKVVRTPDLTSFEEAGFKLRRDGLGGDRLALLRLISDSQVPTVTRGETLSALVETLAGEIAPLPAPPGLRSRLRPYQQRGAGWLWRLYRTGLGALLADDMGLGKTHQAMALLCAVHARLPAAHFLVVCPRGVLEHWHHLLEEFAPNLPVRVFHGTQRSLGGLPRGAVVLTTYEVALRSLAKLARRSWEVAVFDEAQRVKNPHTKGARAVKAIPAAFRVALTGTPVENHLSELWSIMDLIVPGYLGSERGFRATFRDPSPEQRERLRRRIAPFVLRRIKEHVLDDLPDKTEETIFCALSEEQRELYKAIHAIGTEPIQARLRDPRGEIPYIHIFALLTRLKQVCDHPALLDARHRSAQPGKLEVLDELLDEALASENRIVVFSQYVGMIDLLARHLERRRLPHLVLTGQTRDRGEVLRRFNAARYEPVLLASLLAGGVGIDLTAASVVVHYDRWWNPARENQATDRVHRIGQKRFVQVFKLITRATIEERIDEIIRSKAELAEDVIAPNEELLRRLSREELAALLGIPLSDATP